MVASSPSPRTRIESPSVAEGFPDRPEGADDEGEKEGRYTFTSYRPRPAREATRGPPAPADVTVP
jgi:hypothetical protein